MSRDFPDWVHPDRAAAAMRHFAGTVAVDRLPRLADMIVADAGGELQFELDFAHDEQRQVRVDVRVSGWVPMQCQRTLATYRQPIEAQSVVGVVASEEDAASLPEDYDPQLCPDNRLELLGLIEEEVLLCLPLVPVAPDTSRISVEPQSADTHRPFEALAALKKGRDQ
jgi:uncharacterized protein